MAPVVQKVDNAIHRINHYPLNSAIGFPNTYPWDSDLSVCSAIQLLNNGAFRLELPFVRPWPVGKRYSPGAAQHRGG